MSQGQGGNWHRHHYPIGIFLTLYGLTNLLSTLIDWSEHRRQIAGYLTKTAGLDTGLATSVLAVVHVVEGLLILVTLTGLLRRRDVWFLPVAFGWMTGFAVFCVLDVWAGTMSLLIEHVIYLIGFTLVLLVSYVLGVRARSGQAFPAGRQRTEPTPGALSRTQELALSAIKRWQRTAPPGQVPSPPGAQPVPGIEGPPRDHPPAHPRPHPPSPSAAPQPAQNPAEATIEDPASPPAMPSAPAQSPADAADPAPTADPAPAAPDPSPRGRQYSPLPPPRRFPVHPQDRRPPS